MMEWSCVWPTMNGVPLDTDVKTFPAGTSRPSKSSTVRQHRRREEVRMLGSEKPQSDICPRGYGYVHHNVPAGTVLERVIGVRKLGQFGPTWKDDNDRNACLHPPTVAPAVARTVSNNPIRPSVEPAATRRPSAVIARQNGSRSLRWNSATAVVARASQRIMCPVRLTEASVPSFRDWTARRWSWCPVRDKVVPSFGSSASHRTTALSSPTAARRHPSGDTASPVRMSEWTRTLAFWDAPSQPHAQTIMLLLSPADASRLPSGDHAKARTLPLCPLRISPA